jgi:hypothetical protein
MRPKAGSLSGFESTLVSSTNGVALELELAALGISFCHSRPYHPQTCGKVERATTKRHST